MKIYEILCWCVIFVAILLSFIASYFRDHQTAILSLILATMVERGLYDRKDTNKQKKDVNK